MEPSGAVPASRCFKRSPNLAFDQAVTALLSFREVPPGRPDMAAFVPDDDDIRQFLSDVRRKLPIVKARPDAAKIIAERGLTDDDVLFLIAFSMEAPYPLYL